MALLEKSFENVAEKNDSFDLKLPGNKIKRSDYIEIEPKPSFALKTSKLHENIKTIIYINVCSHESIYEPGPKKSIDVDGNEIEGLNVPISIGDGHNYEREDGSNSLTYDIIVNPKVLEECGTDKTGKYRDFICKLILQSISQKFKVEIDYKYQIIKKKYIGIKKSQFVRKSPSQPVIEEITTEQKENLTTQSSCIQTSSKIVPNKTTGNPREQQNAIPEFHYKCYLKPNTHVSSQINLPDVPLQLFHNKYVEPTMKLEPSYSHIVLDCTFKSILTRNQLSVTSSNYRLQIYSHGSSCLDLYIPFTINPSCTRSSITTVVGSVRQLLLTVVMEIENSPWDKHVDPGSRAWLVSQAIQNDHTHNDATSTSASLDEDSKADVSTLKNNTVISGQTSHVASSSYDSDEVLPEDRFHQRDAGSVFILSQREQAHRDQLIKQERDREKSVIDPSVEYVDVDSFRASSRSNVKSGSDFGDSSSFDSTALLHGQESTDTSITEYTALGIKDSLLKELGKPDGFTSNLWCELVD